MKLWSVAAIALAVGIVAPRAAEPADPYLWLEEVEGAKALDWVKAQNAKTMATIGAEPRFAAMKAEALKILTAKDRIAHPRLQGGLVYNFWQDDAHVKGVWRRATFASYASADPKWDVLLDIDALSKAEGVSWVFHGADCLAPDYKRCMISLSNGGKDADSEREFDLPSLSFVKDGFALDEAKQGTAWLDKDTLLVSRALNADEETDSGYPRVVRAWKRGTPIAAAPIVYSGEKSDVSANGVMLEHGGDRIAFLSRGIDFFTTEYAVMDPKGKVHALPLPKDAEIEGYFSGELILGLKSDWTIGGKTFASGDFVSFTLAPVVAGAAPAPKLLFHPRETQAAQGLEVAKDAVYVQYLDMVKGRVEGFHLVKGAWAGTPVALSDQGAANLESASSDDTRMFVLHQDFLTPDTLLTWDKLGAAPVAVKSLPAQFSAAGLEVTQRMATSKDGTKIPYFLVRKAGVAGPQPTLQYGYGGFELSYLPGQMPISQTIVGKLWLERGGQFAVANIRGGGEFGPRWHQSVLKEKRQGAFDDFAAVSQDLIATGATSAKQLGIIGGSNGGLLMGVELTQHPDLFGAVVIDRPLLDMLRYNHLLAGASWMAEYGNPDIPEERAYIAAYSPYQHIEKSAHYPVPFIYASTRDDRVHPGHARKFAARMLAQGHKIYYFELTEGGHGVGADPLQQSNHYALEFAYLADMLMGN